MRETKEAPLQLKAVEGRRVTWLPAIFGNIDLVGDITQPGSMEASLKARPLLHLWGHNTDLERPPIALVKSAREVGRGGLPERIRNQYKDATGGLEIVSDFFTNDFANSVFEAVVAGAPLGGSFAYDVLHHTMTRHPSGREVRNLWALDVAEVSHVTWPANPASSSNGKNHRALAASRSDWRAYVLEMEQSLNAATLHDANQYLRAHDPRAAIEDIKRWLSLHP